ncbi:unnamed protein product, partial [Laminaria digitata]
MSDAPPVPDIAAIRASLHGLATTTLEPEVQVEVAKVAKIVTRLESKDDESANADLALILAALEADTPNLTLAQELRYAIKMRTGAFSNARTTWFMRLTGGSPTAIIVTGLIASFVTWVMIGPAWLWLYGTFENRSLTYFPANELTTVLVAALLGAMVSIMIRLRDIAEPEDFNPRILLLSAYFKPFIGVIVAVFAYAALKSGIVSSPLLTSATTDQMQNGIYWVVSFICGFSERFAIGLVGDVEKRLGARGE